jgi:hypothetical protein
LWRHSAKARALNSYEKHMSKIPNDAPDRLVDDFVYSWPQWEQITGTSEDTGRRAVKRGELKMTKLSVRRTGLRGSEIRRYLDNRTA